MRRRRPFVACSSLLLAVLACACEANRTHPDEHAAYDAGAAAPLPCVPDLDGRIDPSELQPVLGVPVKYLVSPPGKSRPVDVAGMTDSSGHLVWDWGTDYADDQTATITAQPLQGKWYASSFPSGQFVTPYDAGDTLESVYSQDDTGLYLHGIASTQPKPAEGQTLLVYEQPVLLYKLPLTVGATWTSIGVVKNGVVRGLPYAGQDTYQGSDDATGQLVLPDLTFTQAHRLRFVVTTAPSAGQNVVTRQVSFLFECFGEVARATSEPNETMDDFTTAAEVRRFGL
jgi:hypothetical protein